MSLNPVKLAIKNLQKKIYIRNIIIWTKKYKKLNNIIIKIKNKIASLLLSWIIKTKNWVNLQPLNV
jgi:hypothetical protein